MRVQSLANIERLSNAVLTQMAIEGKLDLVEADHAFCLRAYDRYKGLAATDKTRVQAVVAACHKSNYFVYGGARVHVGEDGVRRVGRVYRLSSEGVKVYYAQILRFDQES